MAAEMSVAVTMLPILLFVICASVEASCAYIIKDRTTEAAFLAARALAVAYRTNANLPTDIPAQQAVFSQIRIPHFVVNNAQFSLPQGSWQTGSSMQTVNVNCAYTSAQYGLAPFPTFSIFNLGKSFQIQSSAACRLN